MQKSPYPAREAAERLLRENPRFVEAPKRNQGFIVGAPIATQAVATIPEGYDFAYLDIYPVRFDLKSGKAFICFDDRVWTDLHIADACAKAKLLDETTFHRMFPLLPALPATS